MIVTWSGKLFTLRVSRCGCDQRLRNRLRERFRSQGTPGMGGRWPPGDPHNGLRGKVLFCIAAWLDDDLQIEEAAVCRQSVLPSDTDHHDSQRGNPLRLVY
jgi:hypothetical protein